MDIQLSDWQCRFCDWVIHPSCSRLWMGSALAICLVDGQAHLSNANFSEERCNYIDDKWLKSPNSKVAHLVHSRCWEFFIRYFIYDDLDLKRLFQAISVIPKHNLHRPFVTPNSDLLPWDDPFTTGFNYMGAPLPNHTKQLAILEPCAFIHANPTDTFSSMPAEILEEIVDCMDMIDYLNLRLASRVMASLFHTQSFWRHRFNIHKERGFLNCLLEEDKNRGHSVKVNWHQIYYKTQPARMLRSQGRNSCRRILAKYWFWLKLSWIRDICLSTKVSYIPLSDEEQRVATDACWHTVNERLRTGSRRWIPKQPHECQVTEFLILPEAFVKIGFWIFHTTTSPFIAGIEFITDSMVPNKGFGYRIPGKRHIIDIGSREQLRGFEVSIGRAGIHAIRVCTTGAKSTSEQTLELHSSGWVGSPEGPDKYNPCSEICSVVSNKEICAIQGGFEDCKLTSLAIGTCLKVPAETTK